MLKHFIYSSFSKLTTSPLCSIYYRYSSKLSSFFCILSFLVRATSIDQTFYSATHYLAAVWLDSRHDFNKSKHQDSESRNVHKLTACLSEHVAKQDHVTQLSQWSYAENQISMQTDMHSSDEYQLHHFSLSYHQESDTSEQLNSRKCKNTVKMQVIVTSVPRLNKAEALINSQWTLASSLRND